MVDKKYSSVIRSTDEKTCTVTAQKPTE